MPITFDEAEKLFLEESYDKAFTAFKEIAEDEKNDLQIRSEAYNMMGVIISGPSPYLSDSDDESGLLYFKASLHLYPQNLGAALNVLENYEAGPTGHRDKETVKAICVYLKSSFGDRLSEREKEIIRKISQKLATL